MARTIELTGTNTRETIESHNTLILDVIDNLQNIKTFGEIIKSIKVTIETVDSEELREDGKVVEIIYPLGRFRHPDMSAEDYSRGCCDEL